jgi:hypothetical protein
MATLHDTALADNSASGTTLATADALAVTSGDLVILIAKWEGSNGVAASADTGASTPTFSVAQAVVNHTNNDLHGAIFYWLATSTGTVNPRLVFDSGRAWRTVKAYSFTPTGGMTFQLDGAGAAAQGSSVDPSAGSASASGAGAAVMGAQCYFAPTPTAGSGWTVPAEFTSSDLLSEYRLPSGSGSITGNISSNGQSGDWIAQMAIFLEVAAGGGSFAPPLTMPPMRAAGR